MREGREGTMHSAPRRQRATMSSRGGGGRRARAASSALRKSHKPGCHVSCSVAGSQLTNPAPV